MAQAAVEAREGARDAGLRRGIGVWGLAFAIVSSTVGAGIFALPGGMARAAGPYALVAYLVCALAMGSVVLCCAEAGSRVPTSGGLYGYIDAAFGPLAGFVAGALVWVSCVLANGGIAAAIAEAVGKLVPALDGPGARAAVALAAIGTMTLLNLAGAKAASRLIGGVTAVKLLPLLLFVGVGALHLAPGRMWQGEAPGAEGIGRAVILSLFAFQGMETALGASGEVASPARTLPRALLGALAFVAVLYVAIQLVAQGLMGAALAGSATPLADAMARIDPRLGTVLLVGAAVSMFGYLGSDILGAPRVLFAFARDGFLPRALGAVSARTGAPVPAILTHAAIAAVLAVSGTFEQLAVLSVLASCLLYVGACLAAWRLRREDVALDGRPLRLPALAVWAGLGTLSMVAVIVLARPVEIAALLAAVVGSTVLYIAVTALRRRRS